MTLIPIQAENLSRLPGVRHAFFTREGGVSEGLYKGLNCGVGSNDDVKAVAENRRRASEWLGGTSDRLITLYQVHSDICLRADEPFADRPQADATASETSGLILGVLTADCAPVLLADAEAGVVGAAHAGWKGALGGVVESTVSEMVSLGAMREKIAAAVGPCIAQPSYEVGPEFKETFQKEDWSFDRFFTPGQGGRFQFDLKSFVAERLAQAGVGSIETAPHDTYADPDRFYSYRRVTHEGEGDYGRMLSAIMLDPA